MLNSKVLQIPKVVSLPGRHVGPKGAPVRISHKRISKLRRVRVLSANEGTEAPAQPTAEAASTSSDGPLSHQPSASTSSALDVSLDIPFTEPSGMDKFWTSARLAFALPWRRFKKGSVLTIKLEGELPDASRSWLDRGPGSSVPQLCQALQKAALDPRISGVAIEFGPLSAGYGKLMEVRRYLTHFRQSGKFSIAFMKQGGEKEYYLASACEKVYAPPTASISLRGFAVGGTFLRGVLDKIGVEPQVQRYGKYKSAGDQLLRRDMSEAQREQLQALLDDVYQNFVSTVAAARNKSEQEVRDLLDAGIYDAKELAQGGWLDGLKYEDEVIDELKQLTAPDAKPEKPLRKVGLKKYGKVNPKAFGLNRGKKRIVVLRTAGAIVGRASGTGSTITPDALIPQLRALAQRKDVVGVVLRVDSPGGDALASDLMWREIKKLGEKKPVIASMADVAASGGYYMAMGCQKIVAEPMTITGSIGVVTGKFNLAELYQKIGYGKELISKGKYAELLADNRPFSEEENALFTESAAHAYASFRNKAASCRNMGVEAMQEVAQGRVWSGRRAREMGLVDALGGVTQAVALVRQAAGIEDGEKTAVLEMGRAQGSPLQLLLGSTAAALAAAAYGTTPTAAASPAALLGLVLAPLLAAQPTPSASITPSNNSSSSSSSLSSLSGSLASPDAMPPAASLSLDLAMGPSAAASAMAAATMLPSLQGGIRYAAEPDSLAVIACGSAEVLAAASVAGGVLGGQPGGVPWWSDEDTFLCE